MRRSKFSLSHYRLFTSDMGELVPLTWFEALPGDTIQQATSMLIRVSPLMAPVMHPCMVRIHHWFVPNRLIWEDWEDFITGGDDGTFEAAPPQITFNSTLASGTLADYLGVPVGDYTSGPLAVSALPFRAFALIYNEHYRDQDLQTELPVSTASGADTTTNTDVKNVAWEKDYFTTARPWEQKGDDVLIPLTGDAPIRGLGSTTQAFAAGPVSAWESDGVEKQYNAYTYLSSGGIGVMEGTASASGVPKIFADLSAVTGVSVNDLREALAQQRFMEARAQFGSRYVEYLRYLGVRSSDARLQNPEYLGGGRQVIQFSEVLQTQRTDPDSTPLGHMGGHGIAALRSNRYRRFFEEHGIVMTLMSVVPKSIYMQALPRQWHRLNKEMYFQKELQFLGDQAIPNVEIQADHTNKTDTFGYQNRFDEYRQLPSSVAGEFNDVLDYWHLARKFETDVALNSSFITSVPTKRVLASTDSDALYCMANHSIQARRLLKRDPRPKTF